MSGTDSDTEIELFCGGSHSFPDTVIIEFFKFNQITFFSPTLKIFERDMFIDIKIWLW